MTRIASILLLVMVGSLSGCSNHQRNYDAIFAYYRYDFTEAREALRSDAQKNDTNVVLNNVRLGLAAMADGDTYEAEHAFNVAFDLLSTAGLNEDRTTAAILIDEGVKIWKGEPFEQAMTYYWVAALYATMGDWENCRAAAANALFRLTDFGADNTPRTMARRAASDPKYLREGYTAVDTDFALGFLMQAIGSQLSGVGGAETQLDAALEIEPGLRPIVQMIRTGMYDTLLLVDYGTGPMKIATGPNDALSRFTAKERYHGAMVVRVDGEEMGRYDAVCDLNDMSVDQRWNNLENIRVAKGKLGNALVAGGAAAMAAAGHQGGEWAAVAGIAMMAVGALMQMGARADTRYIEFAPQSVYVIPLALGGECMLDLSVRGDPGSHLVLPDFVPGTPGRPRAVYLRLHGHGGPDPPWLRATLPMYGNDATGVHTGDWPWILGGRDVSTPTLETLEEYQLNGFLPRFTTNELESLYRAEGIAVGPGNGDGDHASHRHILDGGRALYTPQPYSMGYKRLMYMPHHPYSPRSDTVRNLYPRMGFVSRR